MSCQRCGSAVSLAALYICLSGGMPLASADSEQQEGVCASAGEACSRHGMSMLQRSSSRDASAADIVSETPVSGQERPAPSELSLVSGVGAMDEHEKACANRPNEGLTAALDDVGFFKVRACCCHSFMMEFIRRLIEDQDADAGVCEEGSLHGLTHFFDCSNDPTDYDFARLLAEIRSDSATKGDCVWVGYPHQPGGCPTRLASCASFPGATNPPCVAAISTTAPPAGCFEQDINYGNVNSNDLVPNPGAGAQSENECQQRCAQEAMCTHFSFRTLAHTAGSIGCWLKNYAGPVTKFNVVGIISGPKACR